MPEEQERERPELPSREPEADPASPPTEELQPGALADDPPIKTATYPGQLPTGIPTGVERPWNEVIKASWDSRPPPAADEDADEDPLETGTEASEEETSTLSEAEKTRRLTAGGRRRERRQERQESRHERRESRQEERQGISW